MPDQVDESEQAYDSRLTITGRTITTIGCAGSLTAAFYYLVVPLAGTYLIAQIGAWIVIVAGIIWLIWLFSRGCLNAIITVICIGLSAYLWPLFLAMIPVGLILLIIGIFRLPREQSPIPSQVAKASALPHPSPAPQSVTRRTPEAPRMVERSPSAIAEGPGTFRIITDQRHRDELCNAIQQARSELTIVSPWVSHPA